MAARRRNEDRHGPRSGSPSHCHVGDTRAARERGAEASLVVAASQAQPSVISARSPPGLLSPDNSQRHCDSDHDAGEDREQRCHAQATRRLAAGRWVAQAASPGECSEGQFPPAAGRAR